MIKIKKISLPFLILFYLQSFSQVTKDTIYIYFDSTHEQMKKSSAITYVQKNPKDKVKKSYRYYVDEKTYPDMEMTDTGYTFSHFNQEKSAYKKFGGTPPLVIEKDSSFLKVIKPLTVDFFLTTEYREVRKKLKNYPSKKREVIIFIIDKEEIKNGKITLREVMFSTAHKI